MTDFSKKLAKMGALWKNAAKRDHKASGFECPVADGVYKARLTTVALGESAGKGRLQVAWTWTIAEGEGKGTQPKDFDGLETEDNFFHLQKKIAQLGKDIPNDVAEVEPILKELTKEKPFARIRIKTKAADDGNEYTHIYINKLLDSSGEDVETEEQAPEEGTEGAEAEGGGAAPEPEAEPQPEAEEPQPEPEAEPEPEPEPAPEPEEVRLERGMDVTFRLGGKDVEGNILEFVENNTKARVKMADGKVFKLVIEALTPKPGETEPQEPSVEPEPPPTKPAAAKGRVTPTKPAAPPAAPKRGPGRPPSKK